MVVLDADRFGVSQLHQLRGRVGRGEHAGLCLLVTDAPAGHAVPRAARRRRRDHRRLRAGAARRRAAPRGRRARRRPVRPALAAALLSLLRDEDLIVAARAEASDARRGRPGPLRAPAARRPGRRTGRRRARRVPREGVVAVRDGRRRLCGQPRTAAAECHRHDPHRRRAGQGAAARRAAAGHPADLRPRPRGAVQLARRAGRPRRVRACSTCSPAPARSASRRSRAAPRRSRSSSPTARPARCCARNIATVGLPGAQVLQRDRSRRTSQAMRSRTSRFDLAFADPPYATGRRPAWQTLLAAAGRALARPPGRSSSSSGRPASAAPRWPDTVDGGAATALRRGHALVRSRANDIRVRAARGRGS